MSAQTDPTDPAAERRRKDRERKRRERERKRTADAEAKAAAAASASPPALSWVHLAAAGEALAAGAPRWLAGIEPADVPAATAAAREARRIEAAGTWTMPVLVAAVRDCDADLETVARALDMSSRTDRAGAAHEVRALVETRRELRRERREAVERLQAAERAVVPAAERMLAGVRALAVLLGADGATEPPPALVYAEADLSLRMAEARRRWTRPDAPPKWAPGVREVEVERLRPEAAERLRALVRAGAMRVAELRRWSDDAGEADAPALAVALAECIRDSQIVTEWPVLADEVRSVVEDGPLQRHLLWRAIVGEPEPEPAGGPG